ncbi:sulfatase-like hydrolase/transferase [Schlesneria paludicola]|uniref:sulfatase-like hydrolase/transferase n=1 Tax=Schlesneria paludicola TaxID=360056 RepID=UPI00029A601E|nr:sulfatase-like hydrolase/transferase [Schlesneria paludicola]
MNQFVRLAGIGLLAVSLSNGARIGLAAEKPTALRPNILFLYADDQPFKTISCYPGAPDWVKTPHIDAIAQQGVRFERSYLGPWCMPSRASLLTGCLQHAIRSMTMEGVYPGSRYDPAKCPFVPSEFRKQGYQTAQIGKWHTGTDTGFGRDWDFQIVWNRPGHPDNAGNYYYDQLLTFNGEDRETPGYSSDNYSQWAAEYIQGKHRTADKPWYLWLCYGAIHGPTTPAERHRGTLADKTASLPMDILGPWPDKPAYLNKTRAWMPGPDGTPALMKRNRGAVEPGKSLNAWVQQVNECNLAVDEGVGRVMTALKESGQLENTLVIYTADQGFGLGEHGFSQKVAPYDATLSSPLIISWPGHVPENKVCKHPINSPDLIDFLCRMAGVQISWKTHGRDIRPLLQDPETGNWNSPMLLTNTARSYGEETDVIPTDERLTAASNVPWYVMLRDGRFKYVRYLVPGETEELYDLDSDPDELTNLAHHPEQRHRLAELRTKTINELRRTDAKFVDSMPRTKAEAASESSQ